MTTYKERRAIALELADKTPGYDRVPSPERHAARLCKQPEPPYIGLDFNADRLYPMSRQRRRSQEAKESKEPVLSQALEFALQNKSDDQGLLIRGRSSIRYRPEQAGSRHQPLSIKRSEIAIAALGLAAMVALV